MKKLNSFIVALLLSGTFGQVVAADAVLCNASGDVGTVNGAQEAKRITLSEVNQIRHQDDVRVLIALPSLEQGARGRVPYPKGSAGLEVSDFEINGQHYDLWANFSSWDLERDGGVAGYTFSNLGDASKETWFSNYYLVKQGDQPGESENALLMSGKINGTDGQIYVFLGDIFLNQRDAGLDDNHGHKWNLNAVKTARQDALAKRLK